jgi:acetyltransferase
MTDLGKGSEAKGAAFAAAVDRERVHDVLRGGRRPLDAIFAPRSVAVIGATETAGSVGRTILWNLMSNPFGGAVYPINPKRSSVLGIRSYPRIGDVPDPVELAVIVTPAKVVPGLIADCVQAGVKGAIIISAGFKEVGPEGKALEDQILAEARRGSMRIIGPNCLGVMNPTTGLNATFAGATALPGQVGFISQSGALCTAVLDWSLREQVGFSAFISLGSMLDIGWGDLIDYLGDDPRTRSIILYMESIGDARSFVSAAREVALTKPIIVIKAGRTEAAAKAAASHTGSLTGSDDVLDAAFRRCGVLRVDSIADIFNISSVLGRQPAPRGPKLTIVTNAGGPGVLATDALVGLGGELASISDEAKEKMNAFLPAAWSHNNPIDVLGDADAERYAKAVEIAAADPASDGLLVILTPQAMTDATQTAEKLKPYAKLDGKPILASWMGGAEVAAGESILSKAGIPNFAYPDAAARAFMDMYRYTYNIKGLYETPILVDDPVAGPPDRASAQAIVEAARNEGKTLLDEYESKRLLAAYGIPTVPTEIAETPAAAAEIAARLGFPAVVKLYSKTITHKTDVGGVKLDLKNEAEVKNAFAAIEASVLAKAGPGKFQGVTVQPMIKLEGYELILGSSIDPQFGPVLLFGWGGRLVEVFKDRALALPPLNTTLARRMMERTKIYTALKGVRGYAPVDLAALEGLLTKFARLVVELPAIKEIDINPLLASPDGLIALDARVIVHDRSLSDDSLPRPVIRPYPTKYAAPMTLKDGEAALVRPIRPEDEPLLVEFHEALSERSVYSRYFQALKLSRRTAHERLTRICYLDYDREIALVAETTDPATNRAMILGVGRLSRIRGTRDAEFALLVRDAYQNLGVGSELLRRLIAIGRDEGLARIVGELLMDNREMRKVCEKLGFKVAALEGEPILKAELTL